LRLAEELDDIVKNSHDANSRETIQDLESWLRDLEYEVDVHRLLRYAIRAGRLPIVDYLLDNCKADLRAADVLGRSAIFFAAACPDVQMLEHISNRLANPVLLSDEAKRLDITGVTPLYYAREIKTAECLLTEYAAQDDRILLIKSVLKVEIKKHNMQMIRLSDWEYFLILYGWFYSDFNLPILMGYGVSERSGDRGICTVWDHISRTDLLARLLAHQRKGKRTASEPIWVHIPWTNVSRAAANTDDTDS
jgi:hypothetical protein